MPNQLIAPITPVQLGTSETTIIDLTSAPDEGKRYRVSLYFACVDTTSGASVTLYRYEDGDSAGDDVAFLWKDFALPSSEGRVLNFYVYGNWKVTGLADSSTSVTVQADIVQI